MSKLIANEEGLHIVEANPLAIIRIYSKNGDLRQTIQLGIAPYTQVYLMQDDYIESISEMRFRALGFKASCEDYIERC